jgi:hypothetical protein
MWAKKVTIVAITGIVGAMDILRLWQYAILCKKSRSFVLIPDGDSK